MSELLTCPTKFGDRRYCRDECCAEYNARLRAKIASSVSPEQLRTVLEAIRDYLSDMGSFWEGEPAPGELRGKDLFCAVYALLKNDGAEAVQMVESAAKRAQKIDGVRR